MNTVESLPKKEKLKITLQFLTSVKMFFSLTDIPCLQIDHIFCTLALPTSVVFEMFFNKSYCME